MKSNPFNSKARIRILETDRKGPYQVNISINTEKDPPYQARLYTVKGRNLLLVRHLETLEKCREEATKMLESWSREDIFWRYSNKLTDHICKARSAADDLYLFPEKRSESFKILQKAGQRLIKISKEFEKKLKEDA